MKHLYEACDNYQNYIILRDTSRDEKDTCILDWDLDGDEVEKIANEFHNGKYDERKCVDVKAEWFNFNEMHKRFNEFHSL